LTDGNLNRHLEVLHKAGLVAVEKGYDGRRPLTTCRLTTVGRKRFLEYLALLEKVIRDAQPALGTGRANLSASFAPA
jgi:predicted ArsR family transcriptional regulator